MFKNVGKKIKKLAKVVFIVGIIVFTIVNLFVSIIIGKIIYAPAGFVVLLIFGIAIAGVILTYISSLFIYGFGELIDNSQKLAKTNGNAQDEAE